MAKVSDLRAFLDKTKDIEKKSIEEMLDGTNMDTTINILNKTQVILTQPKDVNEIHGVIDSAIRDRKMQIRSRILSILDSKEVQDYNKELWVDKFCVLNSINIDGLTYEQKVAYADKYIFENPASVDYILYLLEQELISSNKNK